MPRILVTAFDPYDIWTTNASWLTLVELTRDFPVRPSLVTRRYPVDFALLEQRLARDLEQPFDYVIHLGQAPGRSTIQLETIALNRRCDQRQGHATLVAEGPVAYATQFPVDRLSEQIRAAGIPCTISRDAGTYLCNAAFFWSLHIMATRRLPSDALFVHVPLDPSQVATRGGSEPSLPVAMSAQAIRIIIESLLDQEHELPLA